MARRRRSQPEVQPEEWQDEADNMEYVPYPPEDAYAPEDFDDPENPQAYNAEDPDAYEEDYAGGYDEDYVGKYAEALPDDPGLYDGDGFEPEEEKVYARSIFKPNTRKPAFVLSVAVNVVRILALLTVLAGLVGVGAVAGIAKGYVETAPTLDLAAVESQAQTSFIYDAEGNLITEYKGRRQTCLVSYY